MPRWAGCEFPQYEHYVTSPVQFMSSLKSRCWTHPFLEWMNSNFVFHLRHMPTFLWCGRDERSNPTKRPCIVKKNIITMVAHLCNLWCINCTVSSPQANLQDTPLHEDHCSNRPLMKREMFFNKLPKQHKNNMDSVLLNLNRAHTLVQQQHSSDLAPKLFHGSIVSVHLLWLPYSMIKIIKIFSIENETFVKPIVWYFPKNNII